MIHDKIHGTKSERIKSKLRVEYKLKDREVKRRARKDKRAWLEQLGNETEKYAENGRNRELYQNAKKITNNITSRRLDFRTKPPFNAAFFKYIVVGKASSLLFQTKGGIILKDAEPCLLAVIDVHFKELSFNAALNPACP